MDLESKMNGTELTVTLHDELNIITSPQFTDYLNPKLGELTLLKIDFLDCKYVSSAGIRVLLSAYRTLKAKNAKMIISNVGENFKEVLETTGLDKVFEIG